MGEFEEVVEIVGRVKEVRYVFFSCVLPYHEVRGIPYVCVLSFDNGEKQDINKFAYVMRRAAALRNDWPSR